MKKLIVGITFSFIASIAITTIFPTISWEDKLSTLYAVAGIMFSIGMSIIVTTTFAKVKNSTIRERINKAFSKVRNSYILYFLTISVLYMFDNEPSAPICVYRGLYFDYSLFVGLTILLSILFFVINFLELQRLNKQIDEALE